MADRLRSVAQKLKGATARAMSDSNRSKILYELKSKTTDKVLLRRDAITQRIKDAISQYEKFTGVQEVMKLQNNVVSAQERFIAAQDKRRELGRSLADLENRLKDVHAEMHTTMKGEEKYLDLCTEEHKLILQERVLRQQFVEAEREEREKFAEMSAAVKVGHERERAHAERNKYWYIVASIVGTVLGIAGSTINNHLKMAEFRDLMERQMSRSAGVLYTVAGGAGAASSDVDIAQAVREELQYQDNLEQRVKAMQETVTALVNKQTTLIDHMNHQEHNIDVQLRELKKLIIAASSASSYSEAEIAKVLATVHHDLEESHHTDTELPKNRVVLEPSQVITAVGVITCLALIIGSIIGKVA